MKCEFRAKIFVVVVSWQPIIKLNIDSYGSLQVRFKAGQISETVINTVAKLILITHA